MNYCDGRRVQVGDAVLLHHRTYTGVVRHIIDTAEEVDAWKIGELGLMIDTSYGGMVFHPARDLASDEVVFDAGRAK